MKTHFVLPFPVNYIGECIRTVPYAAADYARWETESAGSFYICCLAQNKMESEADHRKWSHDRKCFAVHLSQILYGATSGWLGPEMPCFSKC